MQDAQLREDVTLDDRYAVESGRIILTGIQALARLPLLQARRDRAAGLNTAGFISGYRGSPLGGLDKALWEAAPFLEEARTVFRPGLNEELAATAVWGSQQVGLFPGNRYDGVFGMWYGKAPGVDRSGDALRHANAAGSARFGGALLLAGDDHGCKSSTLPSQSEFVCMDLGIPVLNPANVEEILDFGLIGWAMSRYSGCWSALIALADTMDSAATVDVTGEGLDLHLPSDFELPQGGLNIRLQDTPLEQEERLYNWKLPAAKAFARANDVDRLVVRAPGAKLGIVSTGKAWLDVREALAELGMPHLEDVERHGIRLLKIGMPWPLDEKKVAEFADGLDEILVVEEKRPLIEDQLRAQLYGRPNQPRILGKLGADGRMQLQTAGELSPAKVARAVAKVLPETARTERVERYLAFLVDREQALFDKPPEAARQPLYCAGCPHNTSTQLPEGSRGMAGIGCHYMAQWIDDRTRTFTQMGGEGVPWIGQAPFTDEPHVFTNLGDGTYFHSGILAIRASVAAGVNITYKLLYNDAVAMTGGQSVDGTLAIPDLIVQLQAEGVREVVLVADDPDRHDDTPLHGVKLHPREELEAVQKRLRETEGCTVIIYDQVCATELRRRRKRGQAEPIHTRAVINESVCEGCGDCSVQSRCVAIEPLPTDHGVKRSVNQSVCNADLSCLRGFCPAFVTVEDGRLRRSKGRQMDLDTLKQRLPLPERPSLEHPSNIVITGVGGTGIVTVSQLLAMAAHLDHNAAVTLDMTGLAQKGGAVFSHVRIGSEPDDLHTTRVAAGRADVLLACDLVTAASADALTRISPEHTLAVVNTHLQPTADFVLRQHEDSHGGELMRRLERHARSVLSVDATALAEHLLGGSVTANMLSLGYAWQLGTIPVSLEALERAIELNGTAVEANKLAFNWGRLAAVEPGDDALRLGAEADADVPPMDPPREMSLDARIERIAEELRVFQGNRRLEKRFRGRIDALRTAAAEFGADDSLVLAAARGYARVLMPKDEYEVARLYTDGRFERKLESMFEDGEVSFHLAPPVLGFMKDSRGRPRKFRFGRWMLPLFRALARMRGLRGTWFDPIRFSHDRILDRDLIAEYEQLLDEVRAGLRADNLEAARALLASVDDVRGYGPVREDRFARWHAVLPALRAVFSGEVANDAVRQVDPRDAA